MEKFFHQLKNAKEANANLQTKVANGEKMLLFSAFCNIKKLCRQHIFYLKIFLKAARMAVKKLKVNEFYEDDGLVPIEKQIQSNLYENQRRKTRAASLQIQRFFSPKKNFLPIFLIQKKF